MKACVLATILVPLELSAVDICIDPAVTACTADIMPALTAIPSDIIVACNVIAAAPTVANTLANIMTWALTIASPAPAI